MRHDRSRYASLVLLLVCVAQMFSAANSLGANEIGFVEQFALAEDRTAALSQLIPGTEDYYYYYCLHFQNLQQYDRVEGLLKNWIERHKETALVREIRNRQALLTYNQHPEQSLEYLRRTLGLRFDHQRETVDRASQLPTRMNEDLISRDRLRELALRRHRNLNGFEDSALPWLAATPLNADGRRELLQRLPRPDVAGLARMVLEDLRANRRVSFGTHPIHRQLLRKQLDELIELDGSLLNETIFVHVYLSKLRPAPDSDWINNVEDRRAYLDELWRFVSRLSEAHNSLKANVLFQQLDLDDQTAQYDKARLLTYLKLPRGGHYINPRYLNLAENRRFVANLGEDFREHTGFPPVRNDERVIRRYLQHFFVEATSYDEFTPFVRDTYLKQLFAETKIVNAMGDPEQWASMLSPDAYQQLRDRVDLEFATTNPREFRSGDDVSLDVYIKNVPTLIVKVYRVNALNYYQDQAKQVNTAINLDGLIANREITQTYEESPFRRVRRRISFPEAAGPGVYVIDFIGNGKSSRALIHKGQLRHVVRTMAAGHALTVLDEENQPLNDAQIWMGGEFYRPEANAEIVIPFSTSPREESIVLMHGELATLARFYHGAETYQLHAGVHLDREALRSRRIAPIVIRPKLSIGGTAISLGALENPRLTLVAIDLDGVPSTTTITDLKIADDRDLVHEFRVPPRLNRLSITLTAEVTSLSENRNIDLQVSRSFQINAIDKTPHIDQLELIPAEDGYFINVLGKTGEAKSNRPVSISLKHRDFKDRVDVTLRSDERGRIELGHLNDIVTLDAKIGSSVNEHWNLTTNLASYDRVIHAIVGDVIEIPAAEPANSNLHEYSLLEMRGNTFVADRRDRLSVRDGAIAIEGLAAGDYDLHVTQSNARIRLQIVDGPVQADYAIGKMRMLQLGNDAVLRIASIDVEPGEAVIQLRHATALTRVHVFADYFHPAFGPYEHLAKIDHEPLRGQPRTVLRSLYVQGRTIGDELRYILERKYAMKFPGNMLTRPQLLLNPWDVRDTQTTEETLNRGDAFDAAAPDSALAAEGAAEKQIAVIESSDFSNLDFLSSASFLRLNLKPDANGQVTVDLKSLEGRTTVYVVAIDQDMTVQRTVQLQGADRQQIDLRLVDGLDPNQHFALAKQISLFDEDDELEITNLGSGRYQLYDSLSRVIQLYDTLLPNTHLKDFRFIQRWHDMTDAERRENYSKYACHELNFFLAKKDPEFFQRVIQPYLRFKLDKTFLDHYLLEHDLTDYLSPWAYEQLNAVERILLAQRIDGELVHTLDSLETEWEIVPTDQDELNRLFDTGLLGQALDADAKSEMDKLASLGRRKYANNENELERLAAPRAAGKAGATFGFSDQSLGERTEQLFAGDNQNGAAGALGQSRALKAQSDLRLRDRAAMNRLFQTLDKTKEWAENNYYRLPIREQNASLVTVNDLWLDWARHGDQPAFRSTNFAQVRNFTEAMFALSVLDLPSESPEHETIVVDQTIQIKTKGPGIVLHENIQFAEGQDDAAPVLISQNFFKLSERYEMRNGQRVDRFVGSEFLYQTVYGCQLVITNTTSSEQKLDVLTQLPTGALPVNGAKTTQTVRLRLEPYRTQTLEYYFYFPGPGEFVQFPAHLTQDSRRVAQAPVRHFHVVTRLSDIDRNSWNYVSQNGTDAEVLDFLKTRNLRQVKLDRIAFRMGDLDFYRMSIDTLRQRHVYNDVLWSYAIQHNDVPTINTYLDHADGFLDQCGRLLTSPLAVIDPVTRKTYEHLEYYPLVNARSHRIGSQRQIFNDRMYKQYHDWLTLVSYMREIDDKSRLTTVYYLLLQDRLAEAISHFQQIDPYHLAARMQYDYCHAYLSMSQGDTAQARSIADNYSNHGVDRWRNAFATINGHLNEIEGKGSFAVDPTDRNSSQDQRAAAAPSFDFDVEAGTLKLRHENLEHVTVRYYLMDIELLFSRKPFVQRRDGQFTYIAPNFTEVITLASDRAQTESELPAELLNQNVLIEVEAAGQRQSQPYFSTALSVQVIENFGQLQVTHSESLSAVSTVYCKVYAQLNDGRIVFYKDGYTDLRGRFDYATLSTNTLDSVQRFAILVLSPEDGATVREAAPPKR